MMVRELRPPSYMVREVPDDGLRGATVASPRASAALLLRYPVQEIPWGELAVEAFGVLLLDTRHRVIACHIVSVGSLQATIVHPREVFRAALAEGTAAIVLAHNHPSGDLTPSVEDKALTTRLVAGGVLMGIDVIDHLILSADRYYSFREAGLF